MKFCTECGTKLTDDAIFCTQCGHKTSQIQSQIKIANQTNYKEATRNLARQNENILPLKNDKINSSKQQFLNYKPIIVIVAIILSIVLITTICLTTLFLKLIPYKSFNIKDDELIEILNDLGSYTSQSSLKVDGFDPDTTIYRITCDNETGLLVLSHSFSGHIRCIMVCFEENDVYAAAIISAIAFELDESFSTNKAMNALLLGDKIYSTDKYTAINKELSSDLTGFFLAPTKYSEYCIKSVLSD